MKDERLNVFWWLLYDTYVRFPVACTALLGTAVYILGKRTEGEETQLAMVIGLLVGMFGEGAHQLLRAIKMKPRG